MQYPESLYSYILSVINEERDVPLGIAKLVSCSESSQTLRLVGFMNSTHSL